MQHFEAIEETCFFGVFLFWLGGVMRDFQELLRIPCLAGFRHLRNSWDPLDDIIAVNKIINGIDKLELENYF